jgi:hypothetical protein
MSFPVSIEFENGLYVATLLGVSATRVTGDTREQAIAAIRETLAAKVSKGELIEVDVPCGLSALAGIFRDDPTLGDICDTIYAERDSETPV